MSIALLYVCCNCCKYKALLITMQINDEQISLYIVINNHYK